MGRERGGEGGEVFNLIRCGRVVRSRPLPPSPFPPPPSPFSPHLASSTREAWLAVAWLAVADEILDIVTLPFLVRILAGIGGGL